MRLNGQNWPGPTLERAIKLEDLKSLIQKGSLYAVLDACDSSCILEKVESLDKKVVTSLYRGAFADNYRAQAPYLVRFDYPLLAWLLDNQWNEPWGIFINSQATMETVCTHLRHFLQVKSPSGELWTFRFYDPRILPDFLRHCTAEETREFFGPINDYIVFTHDIPGRAIGLAPTKPTVERTRRGVGEYFQLRSEYVGTLRQKYIRNALIESLSSSRQQAAEDPSDPASILLRDLRGGVVQVGLDINGFIGSTISPKGRKWSFENDQQGRLLHLTNPAGESVRIDYHQNGRLENLSRNGCPMLRVAYDTSNRPERVYYPDGSFAALEYYYSSDESASLPAEVANRLKRITNRLGNSQMFEYDITGDITALADQLGRCTNFEYDRWRRPSRIVYPNGSMECFEYDIHGRPSCIIYSSGKRLEIECDTSGHLLSLRGSDGLESTFIYDERGRMTKARQGTGHVVQFEYDSMGHVVSELQDGEGVYWKYDEDGVLVSLMLPDGQGVRFERNADYEISSITDWTGGRIEFQGSRDTLERTVHFPNGLIEVAKYSPAGLLIHSDVRRVDSASSLFASARGYDEEDRLVKWFDTRLGTRQYQYDAEGQILSVSWPVAQENNETFFYDPAGNRIKNSGHKARINDCNQVEEEGEKKYQYDERGNMTSRAGQRLKFNLYNQLTEATGLNGETVTFGYDALGRRLWKRVLPARRTSVEPSIWLDSSARPVSYKLTRYLWAGEQLVREIIEEVLPRGQKQTTLRDYIYHPDSLSPLVVRINNDVYYYHNDPLGTPQRLTDKDGNIVWEAEYSAFGETRYKVCDIHQPFRFPGQYADDETGLYYNRFRYYDPILGRYISRDPASYLGGSNFYCYCSNDPINHFDRFGLWSWRALAVGVAVSLAVAALAMVAAPALIAAAGVTAASAAGMAIGAGVIITSGAIAGAVTAGINSYLDQGHVCWPCVWQGAKIGSLASLPFLAILCPPVAALVGWKAIAAFSGLGFVSGNIGYFAEMEQFDFLDYIITVGLSTVTAGLFRGLAGSRTARLQQDMAVNPEPPPAKPLTRSIGGNSQQQAQLATDIQAARAQGARDFRVNQQQVNANEVRVGVNRPDLQYTLDGKRYYIEYDTPASGRGPAHAERILANDPDGIVMLKIIPTDGTPVRTVVVTRAVPPVLPPGGEQQEKR